MLRYRNKKNAEQYGSATINIGSSKVHKDITSNKLQPSAFLQYTWVSKQNKMTMNQWLLELKKSNIGDVLHTLILAKINLYSKMVSKRQEH